MKSARALMGGIIIIFLHFMCLTNACPKNHDTCRIGVWLWLTDVYEVNHQKSEVDLHFYVRFRVPLDKCANLHPLDTMEILHAKVVTKTNESYESQRGERLENAKVRAVIGDSLDLKKFPFDIHHVSVDLEDACNGIPDFVYEDDPLIDGYKRIKPEVHAPDWKVSAIKVKVGEYSYPWNDQKDSSFSRYTASFTICRRAPWAIFWEKMGPIFASVLLAYFSLFLANNKDSNVGRQLCISSLLVLITSFVTLHQVLPLGFSFPDMLLFLSGLFILSCLFKLSPFDEKDFQLVKRNGKLVLSDQADNRKPLLRFFRVTQYRIVQVNNWLGFRNRLLFYILAFLACMFFWVLY